MTTFFFFFRSFWWLLALWMPMACVDPEDLDLKGRINIIVVDGAISNLNEPQIVRLNRSKADVLTGRFGSLPLTGISVEIVVDSTQVIAMHEVTAGQYQAPDGFIGQIGHQYQLRFRLQDGTLYESGPEVMPAVPPIDRITARFNITSLPATLYDGTTNLYRGAHQLLIDWQDPANEHNYYRWDWKLWEKQDWCRSCIQGFYEQYNPINKTMLYEDCYAPPEFQLLRDNYGGHILYFVNDYLCRTNCWEILSNSDINVFDDQYSNGGRIEGRTVATIPYYQTRGCLVEIRQSALTRQAYTYFKLFQGQTQNAGGLADTPPTALVGNVHNVANNREAVVGYFSASAVAANRYWLDRKDATGPTPGLFVALNGRLPSPEGSVDPNTGDVKPIDPYTGLIEKVPTALCVPSDSRTPTKPQGWQD